MNIHTVPARCNIPADFYAVTNGFRACRAHMTREPIWCCDPGIGPCDHPLDGANASRYARRPSTWIARAVRHLERTTPDASTPDAVATLIAALRRVLERS